LNENSPLISDTYIEACMMMKKEEFSIEKNYVVARYVCR